MMQSHTRRSPRLDTIEGFIARQKREDAQQRRKFWLSVLRPVVAAALLIAVAYLLGVEVKR